VPIESHVDETARGRSGGALLNFRVGNHLIGSHHRAA